MKRILKILALIVSMIVVLVIGILIYVNVVSSVDEPIVSESIYANERVTEIDSGLFVLGNNWFRKSESGLYELYVEGRPYDRGVAIGKLTKNLVQYQEEVFNKQIDQLVPSGFYKGMLRYFIGWFNRDLDDHVQPEFRQEIFGVSHAASADFDGIAPAYQRILNYHAAHDIGHALQNMALVGCTSFATWDSRSADSTLIVGRNFDFYVGDEFAKNKIIAFYKPEAGYKFMMVTFGGMTGVLSGMNDQGLTVTINAGKSDIPSSSATPVSLVAREILQYASTISEAHSIAKKRKMFVAESFLIASAKDGRAAIIEKSPDRIALYAEHDDDIIATNHFQSDSLGNTELNRKHLETSASPYRYRRVEELLTGQNSVEKTLSLLRDRGGIGNKEIGLGNEKSVNQLIAHHGIIFQPEKRRVWISTEPWQLGKFVCYDLSKVFNLEMKKNSEIYERELELPSDPFLKEKEFSNAVKFNAFRFPFSPKLNLNPDSLVHWNPDSYLSYMLAGEFYFDREEFAAAKQMYESGLTKEIATHEERQHMQHRLAECKDQLK